MSHRKDLSGALAAIQKQPGKKFWRSLEELADTPEFRELIQREFPAQASVWPESLDRRQFLTLMGASLALAGLTGCSVRPAPDETIVPYVRPPEEVVPGRPLFYATAMTLGGAGVGLLVESHEGRPTKIEGNPEHPASLGATSLYHQASILTLYDPDRSQVATHLGHTRTWPDAKQALRAALEQQRGKRGAGLRILTETVVSPTLAAQIAELLQQFPDAQWHQYEPLARDNALRAAHMTFTEPVGTHYNFRDADRVLSLDADFLCHGPASLRYTADFMGRRRVRTTEANARDAQMNRLYVVETAVTGTGAKADHRLAMPAGQIAGFAQALAARLGVTGGGSGGELPGDAGRWIAAVARDLDQHRGRSIVIAGDRQPPIVHLLAHQMNRRLGNMGRTAIYTVPIEARPVDHAASLRQLAEAMVEGTVDLLLIVGGNPVYNAPDDLRFGERMRSLRERREREGQPALFVHLSLYQDETSRQCHWHIPETHYLEAWSDTRAYDGTASIVQPLIEPLYRNRSAHELLAVLSGHQGIPPLEIVRATWPRHWESRGASGRFDEFWQMSVHDGVIADTKSSPREVHWRDDWQRHLNRGALAAGAAGTYELVLEADPTVYDGRFANNGWLQECPKPITTITWDNAAITSPRTARDMGVGLGDYAHGGEHGGYHPDVVEITVGDHRVQVPVWIMPGHADGTVTLYLGYGRDSAGRVGGNSNHRVGVNAYLLRTADHAWIVRGVAMRKTGRRQLVACTQQHHLMENRDPVRATTLSEYRRAPGSVHEEETRVRHEQERGVRRPLSMYDANEHPYNDHKWGMAIDLTACTGCQACVIACQSENNIPVVGKQQVAAGREMHWLRIDRYISGTSDDPTGFHFQPVPCMHCEEAPCEYVCPVEATVHSADGLNEMIYQRCVGTRFCSNNCPYKVRRFNFFFYADYTTPSVRQQYNPDVTVRSRGVMEKCSYCVQRIRQAEIQSQVEHRAIFDGEILTACQAACPASAIVFGDINDRQSTVRAWKESPLHYALLAEVNTRPRTTYLAALRNPNPELEAESHDH
jgi:molybdopterin-containing oxidoreductase family iron-sulfur binding subunit